MKTVEFKFELYEKVVTPFGQPAIITMLGLDDGGITYYVKTAEGGSWYKEDQLGK